MNAVSGERLADNEKFLRATVGEPASIIRPSALDMPGSGAPPADSTVWPCSRSAHSWR
jgi:hypothetical protein